MRHRWIDNLQGVAGLRAGFTFRPGRGVLDRPPIPHSPLATSEVLAQVTPRMFSPSIDTMASVSFLNLDAFARD
jgi:hypothetical protein